MKQLQVVKASLVTAREVLQMHIHHNLHLKDLTDVQKNWIIMAMEEYGSRCVIEESQSYTDYETKDHPEDLCQICGDFNPTWSCDNELFNKVNGSPNGIMCPTCFSHMANKKGIDVWLSVKDAHDVSKVKCDTCGHQWIAVRPEGVDKLECPNCGNIGYFENIQIQIQ